MYENKKLAAVVAFSILTVGHAVADAMMLVPAAARTAATAAANANSGPEAPGTSGTPGGGGPVSGTLAGATVVVNAAQDVSDTGGNDLSAARALFRSASYPESNYGLESSIVLLNGLGQTFSRTINAEDTSLLDASGTLDASQRLKWNLEWMKRYGYNAHVIVGQRQPAFIAKPASQWGPEEWRTYEDYATKFIRYVVAQYDSTGFPQTVFEVGNEIDITGDTRDLWTLANPSVGQGDDTRYQHYMAVFPVWSRAVQRVAAEYPERSVKIVGPALGGQSLFLSSTFWHERFVGDVAAKGLRLDALTLHFYGDIVNGWANVPGSSLRALLQRMRAALVKAGLGSLPIAVSEYGPSENSDAVFGHINYSHEGAAWAATFVQEALAGTAVAGSYLIVRDNFGPNLTGYPAIASLDHILNGIDYPKPAYNALRMFTMLPGTRKAVTLPVSQSDVRGFASADASGAGLIASNYNFRFNWPSDYTDLTVDQPIVPGFTSLAFEGPATVERYLIDRNTSNLARYIDSGLAPDYNGAMLTRVEYCAATVTQGSLLLPARTLGPSAVSLWMVSSGAKAGLQACQ